MRSQRFLCTAVMVALLPCLAQPTVGEPLASPQQRLESWIEPLVSSQDLAGAVLVQHRGRVLIQGAWGLADPELGIRNQVTTRFAVGSIAKQMTAALVLQLRDEGYFRLDAPVSTLIPMQQRSAQQIRIADLLLHRSGLPRDGTAPGHAASRDTVVNAALAATTRFAPGTRTEYSNLGYVVLAQVVEEVTGQGLAEVLKERIFDPLDMHHSALWDGGDRLPNQAQGLDPARDGGLRGTPPRNVGLQRGAAGIVTTVADLVRWVEGLPRILSETSYREMINDAGDGRGLGVGVYRRGGRRVIGHDGVTHGYTAVLEWYPDEDLIVAYAGNVRTSAFEYLEEALADVAFGEPLPELERPAHLEPAMDPDLVGRYPVHDQLVIEVEQLQGGIELRGTGGYFTPLMSVGRDEYWYRAMYAQIKARRDASGAVDALIWRDVHGRTFTIEKEP